MSKNALNTEIILQDLVTIKEGIYQIVSLQPDLLKKMEILISENRTSKSNSNNSTVKILNRLESQSKQIESTQLEIQQLNSLQEQATNRFEESVSKIKNNMDGNFIALEQKISANIFAIYFTSFSLFVVLILGIFILNFKINQVSVEHLNSQYRNGYEEGRTDIQVYFRNFLQDDKKANELFEKWKNEKPTE